MAPSTKVLRTNFRNFKQMQNLTCSNSDGRVVKAFAAGAVNLGLIPSRVKPMTLK